MTSEEFNQLLAASASARMQNEDRRDTAQATRLAATRLREVIKALELQLEERKQAEANTARSERISRWISILSLVVAIASLAIAVIAVTVTGSSA